jgi:hypothetical protein
MSLIRLSRRESWWKDAEILMLRHQLAVAERERPKARARLAWPDRAWLALLAGTVPAGRLAGMRLLVTPGTILRWHRDIVCRRWGHLSRRGRSGRPGHASQCAVGSAAARPGERVLGIPADPRRACGTGHHRGAQDERASPAARTGAAPSPMSLAGPDAGARGPLSGDAAAPAVPVFLYSGLAGFHTEAAQLGSLAEAALEFGEAGETGQADNVVP